MRVRIWAVCHTNTVNLLLQTVLDAGGLFSLASRNKDTCAGFAPIEYIAQRSIAYARPTTALLLLQRSIAQSRVGARREAAKRFQFVAICSLVFRIPAGDLVLCIPGGKNLSRLRLLLLLLLLLLLRRRLSFCVFHKINSQHVPFGRLLAQSSLSCCTNVNCDLCASAAARSRT